MLSRFGDKRRLVRSFGMLWFAVLPSHLVFVSLFLLYNLSKSMSARLARLYSPIFVRKISGAPWGSMAVVVEFMPRASAHLLFELKQYKRCAEIIEKYNLQLKEVHFLRLLGLAYFEMGRIKDCGACARLWPNTLLNDPNLVQTLAHFQLLDGEDDAIPASLLRGAAQVLPALWRPHQNLSARDELRYTPNDLDLLSGSIGLLFDAYNYLAQRTEHVGRGDLSRALYAGALRVQAALRKRLERRFPEVNGDAAALRAEADIQASADMHVSDACSGFLAEQGVELSELRILPVEWTTQIGHEGMIDILFRMRDLGWWTGQAVILARPETVANHLLLSLYSEQASILIAGVNIEPRIWAELASLQRMYGMNFKAFEHLSGDVVLWQEAGALLMQKWDAQGRGLPVRDKFDQLTQSTPMIAKAVERARAKWGMKPDDWYVCLHMRDASHYSEFRGVGQSHRNSDFHAYIEAIKYITAQGGWVIKLGGPKSRRVPKMERVIDYARSEMRSELFDLHLLRHCKFFIGTTSGLTNVAVSFGIPSALVNCITTDAQLWSDRVRFALKMVQLRDKTIVTQRALTSTPWRWRVFSADVLADNGARLIDNTADEILELVKQVEALARGEECGYVANLTDSPELLREWADSLAFPYFYGNATIGLYFLKKHSANFLE